MNLHTAMQMVRGGRLPLFRKLSGLVQAAEAQSFYAAASSAGLLRTLAAGPLDARAVALQLGLDAEAAGPTVAAWLDVGVAVGALSRRDGAYGLHSDLARGLALPENDDLAAMMEEVGTLHHRLVLDSPALLRAGQRLRLADQDGEVIARSSRALEPFVQEAIDEVLPRQGRLRLLEVGCGSGTHVRHALLRNPELEVLALELQAEVAQAARRNLAAWGLAERCRVQSGDFRELALEGGFDLLTLHNNIYYFPMSDRVDLLRRARGMLRPGGRILLTTACPGGSAPIQVLHLWGLMTQGAGPLPSPEEMKAQLQEAGFGELQAKNRMAPLDSFWSFSGTA